MTDKVQAKKESAATIEGHALKQILEAALLAAGQPLSISQLGSLFTDEERPANKVLSQTLELIDKDCETRGVELTEVASGYRLQVKQGLHEWVSRLWTERPQRYSRALLETMSLIAYRQPITRGEIEAVRGVAVSTNIIRTLQEREWIRVVGHRDVPGKPALFGSTKEFLDYFNLKNLDDLPTLAEIRDMENLEPELDLEPEYEDNQKPASEDLPDEDAAEESDNDAADEANAGESHDDFKDDEFEDDEFEDDDLEHADPEQDDADDLDEDEGPKAEK